MDITLKVNLDELNAILTAVQELPARMANPLTQKLREQAEPQVKSAQPAQSTPLPKK